MRPRFIRSTISRSSALHATIALAAATFSLGVHAQAMHTPLRADALVSAGAPTSVSTDVSSSNSGGNELPEAPAVPLVLEGQAGSLSTPSTTSQIAPKYKGTILPGQSAQPLTAGDKVRFGFVQAVQPFNILSWGVSSAYSQAVDSTPHYGQGWGPYGQRYGAAAARGTMQTLGTDSLFAPLFHDDPRYYELGRQHKILNRGIYAATRVVITRSDSGKQRVNLPLLAAYAVSAGASNAFYPQRDRSGTQTVENYGSSLGGAALGFLFNEFLDDGLRIAHLRK